MRITAISPMRNEGPFMLEWLAYHRLIGFNDFIIFTNDCDDGTNLIAERLDDMGLARHLPNPSILSEGEGGHHWSAMRYINAMERPKRSDWYASFDVDEFFCIHPGKGRLDDLFAALPEAQVIAACQLNFGTNGHEAYVPDKLVTEQFTASMHKDNAAYSWDRARGIKCLVRNDISLSWIGNHSPKIDKDSEAVFVNGSGTRLPDDLLYKGAKSFRSDRLGHDLVQLNHYSLRSRENFLVKTERGDANHPVDPKEFRKSWFRYFRRADDNDIEETSITRHLPDLRDAIAELLKDEELRRLHEAAIEWHCAAIERLREKPPYKGLLKHINKMSEPADNADGEADSAPEAAE
ncbi:MAG: glycosyltransferase family 2 protein [Vannielia sp.]|uniref:glycosyltransferase family 2 protein n=1 Tax=Vannielia sp. TaxID=2813045 RepID=UPI003B8DED64